MQKSHKSVNRPACLFYPRVAIFSLIVMVGSLMSQPAMAALCSGVFPKDSTEQSVAKLDLGIMDRKPGKDYKPFPTAGITLAPGDYFYVGDKLKTKAEIKLSTPGQQVRIFIEGDTEFAAHSEINMGGSAADLLIVVRGDLSIGTKNRINALIYVAGDTDLNPDVHVSGALTAEGSVSTKVKDAIDYDKVAAEKFSSGELCTPDGAAVVDHFELSFKSSALTCQPHKVTIKACANADCSSTYTEGTSRLSLSPAGWDTAVFSFVGSAAGYLSVRKEGSVNLGIAGIPEPAPQQPLTCRIDGVLSTSCSLMFSKSAFIVTVQDFVSGNTVPASIQAVRADPDDPSVCTPAFDSGTRTLDLWFSYVNPTARREQGHQPVTLDGKALGLSPSSHSLTFAVSEDGERAVASIGRLGYVEAGKLKLNVRYSGVGAEAGLEMEGAEDFIVRPANLEVLAIGAPACNPEEAFCNKFKAAGDSFNLMIKARNIKNDVLKNFEHNDVKLEVLSEPDDYYPRGGNPPKVVPAKYDHVFSDEHAADGTVRVETKVDEVGVVKIRAIAEKYLGSDKAVSGVSNFIGRFFPDHFKFEILNQDQGQCGFSYAGLKDSKNGEPFNLEARLTAYNKSGAVTKNYQDEYARLNDSGIKLEPYEDGVLFERGRLRYESYPLKFQEGVAEFAFPGPYMEFDNEHKRLSAQLNISAEDLDEVKGEVRGDDRLEFRLGRLSIGNAHDSELSELSLPVTAEYFDGQGYRRNELDICTRFDPAVADAFEPSAPGGTVPVLSYPDANKDTGSGEYRLKAGSGAYLISAPGVSGSQTIRFNSLPNWLKYDWDEKAPGLESPSGLATFGIYKGNDKIIFRREIIGR